MTTDAAEANRHGRAEQKRQTQRAWLGFVARAAAVVVLAGLASKLLWGHFWDGQILAPVGILAGAELGGWLQRRRRASRSTLRGAEESPEEAR